VTDPRAQFHNNASQATKREMLRQDKLNNTLYGRAQLEIEQLNTGRFAKANPSHSALPEYPKLPENSPWANDPVPPEEPLGIDVEATPVVGEAFEVQASIERANAELPNVVRAARASEPAQHQQR
jgi:hypothetical protein